MQFSLYYSLCVYYVLLFRTFAALAFRSRAAYTPLVLSSYLFCVIRVNHIIGNVYNIYVLYINVYSVCTRVHEREQCVRERRPACVRRARKIKRKRVYREDVHCIIVLRIRLNRLPDNIDRTTDRSWRHERAQSRIRE